MTILIIDDDETTGYLLKYWLNEGRLKEDNINTIYKQSCKDSIETINKEKVNLVLMDVNMPNMNGIECTTKLKKIFPELLIIAISSDNHEEMQNDMLQVGAYDYLSKPLVEEIFTKRIKTYMLLSGLRNVPKKKSQISNLFNDEVFNFHIHFPVSDEDSLIELWGSMLVRFSYYQNIDDLHDTVAHLYEFGLSMFEDKNEFVIIIEENENFLYITIQSSNNISKLLAYSLVKKYDTHMYIFDNNMKLSIKLKKIKIAQDDKKIEKHTEAIPYIIEEKKEELEIFYIFDDEEMEDFDNQLYLVNTYMQKLKTIHSVSDIEQMCIALQKLANILMQHQKLNRLHKCISDFIGIIQTEINTDKKWIDTYPLINTYVEDIITWHKKLFFDGAPSVNFMDDSFEANIRTIRSFISPELENSSTDDIFDF